MRTDELDYDLPEELIAQHPAGRRDESRLLVYERATGAVRHRRFSELPDELHGELVVVNDTRVIPGRLRLTRPGGGKAEVLLLEPVEDGLWEGLARPSRRLRAGQRLGAVELVEPLGDGRWRLRLHGRPDGDVPLPPYITEPLADPERYQTVYARAEGSAATWERIRTAERVLAVGTTTVRVLESLARGAPLRGRTELFVTPGFEFRRVDHLLTNFHLPRSTLLALVMAFAGVEETRRLYRLAIEERYRFYSFGDAMLIL